MSVRLFGRKSFFKGKSLGDIVAQLRDVKGRVVSRTTYKCRYPEKCYTILTRAEVYHDGKGIKANIFGYDVFRGMRDSKEKKIKKYSVKDWFLVPKEEEEEFCKITEVYVPPTSVHEEPPMLSVPPIMAYLTKLELDDNNMTYKEPLKCQRVTTIHKVRSTLDLDSYVESIKHASVHDIKEGNIEPPICKAKFQ